MVAREDPEAANQIRDRLPRSPQRPNLMGLGVGQPGWAAGVPAPGRLARGGGPLVHQLPLVGSQRREDAGQHPPRGGGVVDPLRSERSNTPASVKASTVRMIPDSDWPRRSSATTTTTSPARV